MKRRDCRVVLAVVLLAAMAGASHAPAADPLRGLPPGADLIGCMSMVTARTRPGFKDRLDTIRSQFAAAGQSQRLEEVLAMASVDFEKDIDSLAFAAYYPPAGDAAAEPEVAIVARGRFDIAKIVSAIEKSAPAEGLTVKKTNIEDVAGLVLTSRKPSDSPAHLAFPGAKEILMGTSAKRLAAALTALKSDRSAGGDSAVKGLLASVDQSAMIWAAGKIPPPPRQPGAPNPAQGSPSHAESFTFSLDTSHGMAIAVAVHFTDAQGAQMAQAQVGMIQMVVAGQVLNNPQMSENQKSMIDRAMRKLAIAADGTRLRASLDLDAAEFNALSQALRTLGSQMQAMRK